MGNSDGKKPIKYSVNKTISFWILLCVALLLIAFALVIQSMYLTEVIKQTTEQRLESMAKPWWAGYVFWYSLLKEIGIAIIIAIIIGIIYENAARREQVSATESLMEQVSKNVFHAVLKTRLPDKLVYKTLDSMLTAEATREKSKLSYSFDSIKINEKKYIQLKVTHQYDLRNLSGSKRDIPIRLFMPTWPDSELSEYTKVDKVTVNNNAFNEKQIADGHKCNTDYEKKYEWKESTEDGQTVSVYVEYCLLKEFSDNEVWTSLYPTMTVDITIEVNMDEIVWGIDALHSGAVEPADGISEGPYGRGKLHFRATEPILPFQGILIWWKSKAS